MTEDECLLAFGKPQTIQESNGEVQWMYSARSTYSSRMDMWKRLSNNPIKTNHLKIKQLKQFIMKTTWKAIVCIVAVLLSFKHLFLWR